MTQQWKFLVVNVTYRDASQQVADFVSANYRHIFSYILKEDFVAYLDQLSSAGWRLTRMQSLNNGRDEAYYFRLPLVS
jgi:hypothetical protein